MSRCTSLAIIVSAALLASGCDLLGRRRQAAWVRHDTTFLHPGFAAGPALTTGVGGALVEERRYEPFGAPLDGADLAAEPTNGLNKPTDVTTGLSYHGARWMAPLTARWLSPDPPVKAPDPQFMTEPWGLHPYQYVAQNPIAYWDPDGRQAARVPAPVPVPARVVAKREWYYRVLEFDWKVSKGARDILNPIFKTYFGYDVARLKIHFVPSLPRGTEAMTLDDEILINESHWITLSPTEQLELIAHEALHSVQYAHLGRFSIFRFPIRYRKEFGTEGNYDPPPALEGMPLEDFDPLDKRYTFDQLAEKVSHEVRKRITPGP